MARLVDFVAEVGRDVPLHFSAYQPDWKFNAPPTPPATLARAAALARRKLDYVYVGNVRLRGGADTRLSALRRAVRRARGVHHARPAARRRALPGLRPCAAVRRAAG